ncbi:vWA domain-containing protein [Treponema bryantii]|uniref:vWA domain-containing protein n=1 Tax=Treponema bryantii TaxID=163 RepID=UPI0003B7B74B|nr:vWA domain-containing protein [Treponema bryantii]
MNKTIKKIFLFLTITLLALNLTFAQNTNNNSTSKGKIVIVVLDVSGSIKKQFPDITKIIDRAINKNRLNVGDYFVLIPFGDSALPMYSGQLMREEDKTSISNTLKAMKADNDFTDIGTAIKTALNYIVDLKSDDYNLYEPLVLFITDGDITTPTSSEFHGQNVDQIFNDPLIGNKYLYDGWYYVGIGKNLHDLPLIAEKSGREDYLLRIEDLDQLEFMLDDWISKIPESQPIEQGEVLFNNFKLKSYKLKSGKNSKVISSAEDLTFDILNTYKRTPVNVEFKAAKATFQSDDRSSTIQIKLSPETGIIQVSPMHTKTTTCGFNPNSEIKGKGILKIHFVANINGLDKQFDEAFDIDGKTASELLFDKIFWPLIIILILIVIIVSWTIIKKFLPIKVRMEVVGIRTEKQRPVSIKLKKRVEFGSRPGCPFKLDQLLFSPVVGQIQRINANKWQIIPRDSSAFEDGNKKIEYTLGSDLKLKTKEDSIVTIKFKPAKK